MCFKIFCVGGSLFFSRIRIYESISMYYHSNMRDIFVGIMICVSFFLMTYRGYDVLDSVIYKITGIAGIGIALFPCKVIVHTRPVSAFLVSNTVSNYIHLISAVLFFFLLAINSIFLFTRSEIKVIRGTKKGNIS